MLDTSPDTVRTQRDIERSAVLPIANQYLSGRAPIGKTLYRLRQRGTNFSGLVAAELLIDEAWKSAPLTAGSEIERATRHYEKVKAVARRPGEFDFETHLRAKIRLAQLPVLALMLGQRELPPSEATQKMYGDLLKISHKALTRFDHMRDELPVSTRRIVAGTASELAVLLLGQRHALREDIAQSWLPLQSRFSEDHGGNCYGRSEVPGWDTSFYTQTPGAPIALGATLEVKTSGRAEDKNPGTVRLDPDLALRPGEHEIYRKIIAACVFEAEPGGRDTSRVSAELNDRTVKLLGAIANT